MARSVEIRPRQPVLISWASKVCHISACPLLPQIGPRVVKVRSVDEVGGVDVVTNFICGRKTLRRFCWIYDRSIQMQNTAQVHSGEWLISYLANCCYGQWVHWHWNGYDPLHRSWLTNKKLVTFIASNKCSERRATTRSNTVKSMKSASQWICTYKKGVHISFFTTPVQQPSLWSATLEPVRPSV